MGDGRTERMWARANNAFLLRSTASLHELPHLNRCIESSSDESSKPNSSRSEHEGVFWRKMINIDLALQVIWRTKFYQANYHVCAIQKLLTKATNGHFSNIYSSAYRNSLELPLRLLTFRYFLCLTRASVRRREPTRGFCTMYRQIWHAL